MLVGRMPLLKQAPSSSTAQLKQRVRRLAPYRPFGPGEGKVEFVRRQLVLAAAFEEEHGFASLAECRDSCTALWGVEIEIDELIPTMKALTAEGRVTRAGGYYALTQGAREEIAAVMEQSAAIEAAALAHWETAITALTAKLDDDDIGTLRADLLTWLHRIIAHYGMEAALILYPEQERAQRFFEEVALLGFQFLPDRDEPLAAVRSTALYLFIREPSSASRVFIANLMTTAYMVAVFTLDPAAEQLVQAVTAGQRLYLNTNVLYSALNLNGPRAYLSTRRALSLSRDLGYELAVTPWTVAEMKESVRHCRHLLAKTALPPRALADIAANAADEGSFVAAFWRKYRDTGITPQDFCDFHEQVEALLEKMEIKIIDEGCAEVDEDRGAIEKEIVAIERISGSDTKTEGAKLHDAKHRLLIDRLRGDRERQRFSEAGYWFVTRDGVLIPYGMAERAPSTLPFAVSLTAWAQIVRGFTARTEDYDQTLVDFLDTPALRPRGVNWSARRRSPRRWDGSTSSCRIRRRSRPPTPKPLMSNERPVSSTQYNGMRVEPPRHCPYLSWTARRSDQRAWLGRRVRFDRLALRADTATHHRLVLVVGGVGMRRPRGLLVLRCIPRAGGALLGRGHGLVRAAPRPLAVAALAASADPGARQAQPGRRGRAPHARPHPSPPPLTAAPEPPDPPEPSSPESSFRAGDRAGRGHLRTPVSSRCRSLRAGRSAPPGLGAPTT
jgi:hypothetical protein